MPLLLAFALPASSAPPQGGVGLTAAQARSGPTAAQARSGFLVNAGGGDLVDRLGRHWSPDREWVAGSFGYVGGSYVTHSFPVTGTDDDSLYQTTRAGASFEYRFDQMPAGAYEVRLFFCEAQNIRARQRTFDVLAEGVPVLTNYDVFLYSGSPNALSTNFVGSLKAGCEVFTTSVLDGQLNLRFNVVTGTQAIVSGIMITPAADAPRASYTDVASRVGIVHNNVRSPQQCAPDTGTGSAWADFDNDGRVDLYMTVNGAANRLYRNLGDTNGDGLPDFADVAAAMGVDDPTGLSHSAVFIDYDNDGDQDLFVSNWGANRLFENQLVPSGSPGFTDVTAAAGLADAGRTITAAWGDFDVDGYLDVYVAKHVDCAGQALLVRDHLYRNNGDGTFTDVTSFLCGGSSHCPQTSGVGFSAAWVDLDDDGDQDLYLVNDSLVLPSTYPNVLWRNDGPGGPGNWIFTDVSAQSGANLAVNGMGLAVGDIDNDGAMDLAFSNIGPNNLLRNKGNGTFEDWSALMGIQRSYLRNVNDPTREQWTWGSVFFDHDNDGWLDLYFVGGYLNDARALHPGAFFRNMRGRKFVDLSSSSGLGVPGRGRNASIVDFDGDGFVDLFVNQIGDAGLGPNKSNGTPRLFRNNAVAQGNRNHWLTVTVQGTMSNRDGIGTRLRVVRPLAPTLTRDITSGPTHGGGDHRAAYFGLGSSTVVMVNIRWPSGVTEIKGPLAVDRAYHFVEPP